jgi:uridine kinase
MVLLIGVCGKTASGKTSIAREICKQLTALSISNGLIQMDDMYRELTDEEHELAVRGDYDFDQLDAFDLTEFHKQLQRAANGQSVEFKDYNHATHKHGTTPIVLPPADIWVVEGLYLFADTQIVNNFGLKLFMDVDSDVSLIRRIRRDCIERDRTVESVLKQYERFVKPAYEKLVEPYRNRSNMVIISKLDNQIALDMVLRFCEANVKQK